MRQTHPIAKIIVNWKKNWRGTLWAKLVQLKINYAFRLLLNTMIVEIKKCANDPLIILCLLRLKLRANDLPISRAHWEKARKGLFTFSVIKYCKHCEHFIFFFLSDSWSSCMFSFSSRLCLPMLVLLKMTRDFENVRNICMIYAPISIIY